MTRKISLNDNIITPGQAKKHHEDIRDSIVQIAASVKIEIANSPLTPDSRYFGKSADEVDRYFERLLDEIDMQACLFLLSSAEGALKRDFFMRIRKRKKDPVSKAFRAIYRSVHGRPKLEQDVLATWANTHTPSKIHIDKLRGALKYRHWLAHGRYWIPKWGKQYDPAGVFAIISSVFHHIHLPL